MRNVVRDSNNLQALCLAVVLIISTFGTTAVLSDSVGAAEVNRGDASPDNFDGWDTSSGSGDVGDKADVYQGEGDITLIDNGEGPNSPGTKIDPKELQGVDNGISLNFPIPEDYKKQKYTTNGRDFDDNNFGVRVRGPKITSFNVTNDDGEDVSGSSINKLNSDLHVGVDYNFNDAEDIKITVVEKDGLEVTNEFIKGPTSLHPSDVNTSANAVVFDIDLDTVPPGEYTITVEGVDDLNHGSASKSTTITVTEIDDQEGSISVNKDNITLGERVIYSTGRSGAANHLITIDREDYRNDKITVADAADTFWSNVGLNVTESGIVTEDAISRGGTAQNTHTLTELESAGLDTDTIEEFEAAMDTTILYSYAVVESDGEGALRTEALTDGEVPITLYGDASVDNGSIRDPQQSPGDPIDVFGAVEIDQVTVSINASISLHSPQNPYVAGNEVTITGSAPGKLDGVVVYARASDKWERVTGTISTDRDGAFAEDDFNLMNDSVTTEIFSFPGNYFIGVIAAKDADIDRDGSPDDTISVEAFTNGLSTSKTLRVIEPELEAEIGVINGSMATEDSVISINGSAPSADQVDVVIVGSRGSVQVGTLAVDDDGTFGDETFAVETDLINWGPATVYVLAPGRDQVYGESDVGAGEVEQVPGVPDGGTNKQVAGQIQERIIKNTVEASGSDDLVVKEEFKITRGITRIQSVFPEGAPDAAVVGSDEPIVVKGTTNRNPRKATIFVGLWDDEDRILFTEATSWGQDGRWSVVFNESDIKPGTYTVWADDGESLDRTHVRIVRTRATETPTATPVTEMTATAATPTSDEVSPPSPPAPTTANETPTSVRATVAVSTATRAAEPETPVPQTPTSGSNFVGKQSGLTAEVPLTAIPMLWILAVVIVVFIYPLYDTHLRRTK